MTPDTVRKRTLPRIQVRWYVKDGNVIGECHTLWHAIRTCWMILRRTYAQ